MPVIQLIEGHPEFRKSIKAALKNRYQIFLSSSYKEALRSVQKNSVDIALIHIETPFSTTKNWIQKLTRHKDLAAGELAILLLVDWKFASQENFPEIAGETGITDIMWLPENAGLSSKEFYAGLRIFLDKNYQTLQARRGYRIQTAQKEYFETRLSGLIEKQKNGSGRNREAAKHPEELANFFRTGASRYARQLLDLIEAAPEEKSPVFLSGVRGLEQEEIARAIHRNSWQPRYHDNFYRIDLANIPPHLQDRVLFGNNEKNLPGFGRAKSGLLEQLGRGTVFIESVERLKWNLQADLLRALRMGYYMRGSEKIKIKCRFIFSSYIDLEKLVDKGLFRQDLNSHIHGYVIPIPTLAQRKNDIALFIENFLSWYRSEHDRQLEADTEFKQALINRKFPGQVSELRETLLQLCHLASGELNLTLLRHFDTSSPGAGAELSKHDSAENEHRSARLRQELGSFSPNVFLRENDQPENLTLFSDNSPLRPEYSLSELEREYIILVLESTHYNISETSRILGIARKTLYKKLLEYGIQRTRRKSG